jgi:hypothetical protein
VKKTYHIVNREEKTAAAAVEEFAKANGQLLLPLVELITNARIAVDEVIGLIGRQTIEAILTLSATEVAGPPRRASPAATSFGTGRRTAGSCSPTGS